ncbi:outer membrane protein assembly factor BamE [Xenorhabdus sp. Sc-CR9]|uniref:outer membrane protein assembly factor BamE n=1 Tax=Xenorhabdus sp. Sc-CR9 TaxID=2584468 RepID=UPI001F2F1C76|nr:outer membrane protein assembly factor BamE [Xenorhabdus sp. Sc-CR9]
MIDWNLFINALGATESSKEFSELCLAIEEQAQVSQDPLEYNLPEGPTTYYSFIRSGIEIGFIQEKLNHIRFYSDNNDEYENFTGVLISDIQMGWNKEKVLKVLGTPSRTGGGEVGMFHRYIDDWIKYEYPEYALHFQFNPDGLLCHSTLMQR